jgi:uncharacterized protein
MIAIETIAARARHASSGDPNVPSPCVSVCVMNPQAGLCQGCARTLDEIAGWSVMDADAKRAVWRLIEQRLDLPAA